jgi:hypothetical protein
MKAELLVDPERIGSTDHRRGALGSVLIATAWVALALWRPTVTYHLAPFLVAGAWPFLLRNGPLRVANVDAMRGTIAGFVVTMVAALVLVAADAMRGPTLWDGRHAMLEVVPIALAGAVTGYRVARCGVAVDP